MDAAEALAVKVRQRLLYSSSALKTQGAHLEQGDASFASLTHFFISKCAASQVCDDDDTSCLNSGVRSGGADFEVLTATFPWMPLFPSPAKGKS